MVLIALAPWIAFSSGGVGPDAGQKPAARPILYVKITDPDEHAFSVEVPAGWSVKAGTNRRGATDLVHYFSASSPDSRIAVQYNDPSIPACTLPSQLLRIAGFQEGDWYESRFGVRQLICRYLPGNQILSEYLKKNIGTYFEQ